MTDKLGPTQIMVPTLICGECMYHAIQHDAAVTTHRCSHPDAKSRFFGGTGLGVRIGIGVDLCPTWCPEIREEL